MIRWLGAVNVRAVLAPGGITRITVARSVDLAMQAFLLIPK
jgi:hypothetical protein